MRARASRVSAGLVLVLGLWLLGGGAWAQGEQAAPADKKDPPAKAQEGTHVYQPQDPEPAAREAEIREQLKGNPDDPELLFKLGNALYDMGRRTEAKETFLKVLERKPDFVKAMVNLGVVLNEDGDSEMALQYFSKADSIAPNDVTVLCNKGQALYAMKQYEKAIDLYQKSISIDPKNALPRYLLGVAFADAGIYREAIREWREVVAIDPTSEAASTAAENIKVLQGMVPGGDTE